MENQGDDIILYIYEYLEPIYICILNNKKDYAASLGCVSKYYNLKETLLLMIYAGVDMFCFGNNLHYDIDLLAKVSNLLLELYEEKKITEDQIHTSYVRIMNMKKSIGIID